MEERPEPSILADGRPPDRGRDEDLVARGRVSEAAEKSHRHSLPSSPTETIRRDSSPRKFHGSNTTEETKEWCPMPRATMRRCCGANILMRSSCPPAYSQ